MTPLETFIFAFATIAISIVLLICLVLTIGRWLGDMTQRQKTAFFIFLGLFFAAALAFGITVDIHNGVAG